MEIHNLVPTLFRPISSGEIPTENLFIQRYNECPSRVTIANDVKLSEMGEILKSNKLIYKVINLNDKNKETFTDFIYEYQEKILIRLSKDNYRDTDLPLMSSDEETISPKDDDKYNITVFFAISHEKAVNNLIEKLKEKLVVKDDTTPKFNLVVGSGGDYYLKSYALKKNEIELATNYSESIVLKHESILAKLNEKNNNGILFLHGKPGTGKSFYIRHLINSIKKTVIYLPPDMSQLITTPEFIPFLSEYPNSVILIEDAENVIGKRQSGSGNHSIANLLNLSDGLLSDALSIQVICTFNADKSEIDDALLRKGRLIDILEFEPLEIEKAQNLSNKLGFKTLINERMTLAEIYNQDDTVNEVKKVGPIGFNFDKK